MFYFSNLEVITNSIIESKYLSHVTARNVDCERIIHYYKEKFATISADHLSKHCD